MAPIITEPTRIHPSRRRAIRSRLLDWFAHRKRDLPWRGVGDPYLILVSEAMLQQTQVETVIPYYNRFVGNFPNFEALAGASEEEVLRFWAGLGYYRRARSLHSCAKAVVADFGGRLPEDRESLLSLPGIGPYTAGAILSIAHGLPEPLVDGNVERVLSRLVALDLDLSATPGKKAIWRMASELVPEDRPGDFNQAMMELGATICKPKAPLCAECPVETLCRARLEVSAHRFPVKTRNQKRVDVEEALLLVEWKGRWLLTRSNEEGLYPGLWQFPWAWRSRSEGQVEAALYRLVARYGLSPDPFIPVMETVHHVTFRKIRTKCFLAHLPASNREAIVPDSGVKWVGLGEIGRVGLPSYQRRLAERLKEIR